MGRGECHCSEMLAHAQGHDEWMVEVLGVIGN